MLNCTIVGTIWMYQKLAEVGQMEWKYFKVHPHLYNSPFRNINLMSLTYTPTRFAKKVAVFFLIFEVKQSQRKQTHQCQVSCKGLNILKSWCIVVWQPLFDQCDNKLRQQQCHYNRLQRERGEKVIKERQIKSKEQMVYYLTIIPQVCLLFL